jgi:hypothetical protein
MIDQSSPRRRLPLIYIAGPFRGATPLDVRRNVERARDYGLIVAQAGGYPMIPHTMTSEFDKQLVDQFWLDGTLEMLLRCDAIALIPGWQDSRGATLEQAWASARGMPAWEFSFSCAVADLADWIAGLRPCVLPAVEPI